MIKEALTYDDVLLVPQYSEIESRATVDVSVKMPKDFEFKNPIIPANMKTVTGMEMAELIYSLDGLAILHRFMPIEEQYEIIRNLLKKHPQPTDGSKYKYPLNYIGVSVGIKKEDKEHLTKFVEYLGVNIICIDIAHGDSKMCVDMCEYVAEKYPRCLLIAGNVATGAGARRLWEAGADVVKVGIGPGSLCTTRIETGAGVPQLTAIMEVAAERDYLKKSGVAKFRNRELPFIADGGIKSAGDVVKALCYADMVMVGNVFAGAEETPGITITVEGRQYKEYVGSSTHKGTHIEGVAALVPQKGSAVDIMDKLLQGLRSGCSYSGAKNLDELKENHEFVRITASGLRESHPHDVNVKG